MAQKIDALSQMKVAINTTSGKSGYYVILGDIQYCWGYDVVANSGTTLTFARAFTTTPIVICTTQDTNEQTSWVKSVSTTQVQLAQKYTGNPLPVHWIAIGKS